MRRRAATITALIFGLAVLLPIRAFAAQNVELKASFSPYRLGASTTIRFGFTDTSTIGGGVIPPAVTNIQLSLPAGMGLGLTDLGEAICSPITLLAVGPIKGCSPNSRMGLGTATVEIATESAPVKVLAYLTVYMTVPHEEHTTLLIYAETRSPVAAQFLFPSEVLRSDGDYGPEIQTAMPLIPSWPEGPPVFVTHMETTLGPSHLTYYARKHGKLVPYKPEGMTIPNRCPNGGFPFRADYRFSDGSTTEATTRVPCPPSHVRHRKR